MIAVRVTVRDDQIDRLAAPTSQPRADQRVDRADDIDVACTRIKQERAIVPKDQIEERLFEVRARRLAKNIEIIIVRMDPKLRDPGATRAAGVPGRRETSRVE